VLGELRSPFDQLGIEGEVRAVQKSLSLARRSAGEYHHEGGELAARQRTTAAAAEAPKG
jgi:hypothetical protein